MLAFINRTDDLALRTESSRALSAAIRSLHLSTSPTSSTSTNSIDGSLPIEHAKTTLAENPDVVEALTRMIRDALGEEEKAAKANGGQARGRFEVVLTEAIVGLVLLASSNNKGGKFTVYPLGDTGHQKENSAVSHRMFVNFVLSRAVECRSTCRPCPHKTS